MSQANLAIIQDGYAAFGRGDLEALIALMAEDVTIGIVGRAEDAPFFGLHHGKPGVRDFFRELAAAHEIHLFEPTRFLAAEEKVFVWGHYRWTMRNSGVSKESRWMHELSLRNGRVVEWLGHNDTAMLAAAYHGREGADRAAA